MRRLPLATTLEVILSAPDLFGRPRGASELSSDGGGGGAVSALTYLRTVQPWEWAAFLERSGPQVQKIAIF